MIEIICLWIFSVITMFRISFNQKDQKGAHAYARAGIVLVVLICLL